MQTSDENKEVSRHMAMISQRYNLSIDTSRSPHLNSNRLDFFPQPANSFSEFAVWPAAGSGTNS
jgi:hypothetical protein